MRIYDFETTDRYDDIQRKYANYCAITDSLADNRDKYRALSKDVGLDFSVLDETLQNSNHDLLIAMYTYSEQLVKNTYYHLLEYDETDLTDSINAFIASKIPPARFSPNVKYEFLANELSSFVVSGFQFVIRNENDAVKTYDSLVDARHTFAHRGSFVFVNSFEDVLKVLKYLTGELEMLVDRGAVFRIKYQNETRELTKAIIALEASLQKNATNTNKEYIKYQKQQIREIRQRARKYLNSYSKYVVNIDLLSGWLKSLSDFSKCSMRSLGDVTISVNSVVAAIKNAYIVK